MYFLFRLIIIIFVFAGVSIYLIKARKIKKRISWCWVILAASLAGGISQILPVENLFCTFETPEAVFHYLYRYKITDIVYGNESCMVLYEEKPSSAAVVIIPKGANGYKIPNKNSKIGVLTAQGGTSLSTIIKYADLGDHYIFVQNDCRSRSLTISDNLGSQFQAFQKTIYKNEETEVVYEYVVAYIGCYEDAYYSSNYVLTFCDESFSVWK